MDWREMKRIAFMDSYLEIICIIIICFFGFSGNSNTLFTDWIGKIQKINLSISVFLIFYF